METIMLENKLYYSLFTLRFTL